MLGVRVETHDRADVVSPRCQVPSEDHARGVHVVGLVEDQRPGGDCEPDGARHERGEQYEREDAFRLPEPVTEAGQEDPAR